MNSTPLTATWRPISPLAVSATIARTIWLGAAKNKALATKTLLTNSQISRPTTTDKVATRNRSRAEAHISVGGPGDTSQEQTFHAEVFRQVVQLLQCRHQ